MRFPLERHADLHAPVTHVAGEAANETKGETMKGDPVDLDERRGMAAQRSTESRRRLHKVQADQAALRNRQEEFENFPARRSSENMVGGCGQGAISHSALRRHTVRSRPAPSKAHRECTRGSLSIVRLREGGFVTISSTAKPSADLPDAGSTQASPMPRMPIQIRKRMGWRAGLLTLQGEVRVENGRIAVARALVPGGRRR